MSTSAGPRVLSGITPSGRLHLGNYIGAISLWAEQQERYDNFLLVADLHALTVPEAVRGMALRDRAEEILALYVACGVDPQASTLFVQSDVPAHAELGWLLTCATPLSWLERATQYKAKAEAAEAGIGAGLVCYPALQAADILLYDADCVPVGDDQRQHVEISRAIARRFNALFGDTFKVPEPLVREAGSRIMGFDDPTVKMSKSVAQHRPGHAIGLLDPPEQVHRTIMRAVTDSAPGIDFERGLAPGVENLLTVHEALTGTAREDSRRTFEGRRYAELKAAVADVVVERLGEIQRRYRDVTGDRAQLGAIVAEGRERARSIASEKLEAAYRACGLRP